MLRDDSMAQSASPEILRQAFLPLVPFEHLSDAVERDSKPLRNGALAKVLFVEEANYFSPLRYLCLMQRYRF